MAPESQSPAERRLRALARTRRDASRALPPWSAVNRQRLRDEVARLHQSGSALPDPAAHVARPWPVWRMLGAWVGVAAAGAVFVWVVLLSQPPKPWTLALKTSTPTAASESDGLDRPAPVPAPLALPSDAEGAADTAVSGGGGGSVPVSAPGQLAPAARSERFDFNAARRIRHSFRTVAPTGAPPILKAFEIVQTGGGLEILDEDGSVFSGRLPRRAPSGGRQPAWTFEAQGISRTLGKGVRLTGNFGEAAAASGGAAADPAVSAGMAAGTDAVKDYWQETIAASVLVDGGAVFEIRAEPVADAAPEATIAPSVKID